MITPPRREDDGGDGAGGHRLRLGVPTESLAGERRVAIVPASIAALRRIGIEVTVERAAGDAAGFPDGLYEAEGAHLADRDTVFAHSDVLCQVRGPGTNPTGGQRDLERLRAGQVIVGLQDALGGDGAPTPMLRALHERGISVMALERLPRISRAQSMDVLTSQATVAGYRAVLLAAMHLPRLMPMMMTAAGTISAAKVLVLGGGVAGLQAIATARRLGAVVTGYDIRPAVREQVESLGARFLSLGEVDGAQAEDQGGYAKALADEAAARQRSAMAEAIGAMDIVITTAAIPGRPSPRLVTAAAVEGMHPGSVIVDLAAERGGNCELTRADETVHHGGVTILGPTNLPASAPGDASRMFSRNLESLLKLFVHDGLFAPSSEDEIVRTVLLHPPDA